MYKDINDPRDPWAWRNSWTGEARTDYAELWVVIPLIVGLIIVALMLLLPLFIYTHCRNACPCQGLMLFFERFLRVLHQVGLDKEECRRKATAQHQNSTQSFANPAFVPNNHLPSLSKPTKSNPKNNLYRYPQRINRSMRTSSSHINNTKYVRRSKSCPIKKPLKPIVPKIRL